MIDEYVQDYRPTVLRGANADWLFPGTDGGPKNAHLFGIQITERIQKATGLRITLHQFRHAAAAIYLKHHPGDYETVRRLLGHRNIRTTINFYCGLETIQASREFGKIIREHLRFDPDTIPRSPTMSIEQQKAKSGRSDPVPSDRTMAFSREDRLGGSLSAGCPSERGGAASHLRPMTQHILAQRNGLFLDFVLRTKKLDREAQAAGHIVPELIEPL